MRSRPDQSNEFVPAAAGEAAAVAAPPPFLPRAGATWITPELIERTRRVWQPYYSQPLTSADAIEILENTARLIAALGQPAMAQSVSQNAPDRSQKKQRSRKRRAAKA